MKLLRNRLLQKTTAIFFLVVFVNSVLYPTVSYALTTGPHQPEFTSFEDASSADMVNLLTGDFSYNMPILNVPIGEDGEYSIPLSYHAGIGPEQEASWVGLGWNINTGSLTRNINGFPDDASGEIQSINVKDLNFLRGWSASFLGQNIGWDSQNGHYGTISLVGGMKIGYDDSGLSSVGVVGLTVSRGGKVDFSAEQFSMAVFQAAMAVASGGTSTVGQAALNTALQVGTQVAMDMILPEVTPSAPTSGNWKYSKKKDRKLFHTDYWIYLNQTRNEQMYGVLNMQQAPSQLYQGSGISPTHILRINGVDKEVRQFNSTAQVGGAFLGAASDINIDLSGGEYWNISSPSMLAYDNYQVNAPGLSGSIKPYRFEVGSVAVAREMTGHHFRLNVLPYESYKVPFMFDGTIGNRYFNHVGHSSTVSSPAFYYGLASSGSGKQFIYDLNDVIMESSQRIGAQVSAANKLPQGSHVEWVPNVEIKNSTGTFSYGFMDYFPANSGSIQDGERYKFRKSSVNGGVTSYWASSISGDTIFLPSASDFFVNDKLDVMVYSQVPQENPYDPNEIQTGMSQEPYLQLTVLSKTDSYIKVNTNINASSASSILVTLFRGDKADQSIGGYVVTGQDGMNYHFSLPVYDSKFTMQSQKIGESSKSSTVTRSGQFANTWLLTAITGPDFVDRGNPNGTGNGVVGQDDWGYWIKFNYGLHVSDYFWRLPYRDFKADADNSYESFVSGNKEKYYLNSVETKSHVALFVKGARNDAQDALTNSKKSSLRLEEIALLTKEAYQQLTAPAIGFNLADCNGRVDIVYGSQSAAAGSILSTATRTYIQQNSIKRVLFNTDYTLCSGTPNSINSMGKLTLNSVSIRGKNDAKIFPDYKFEYLNNPGFNKDKWDGWGMYSSQAGSSGTSHKASTIDSDGAAWSMTKVTTPLGNKIEVAYERDEYSSISNSVSLPSTPYSAVDLNVSDGVTSISSTSGLSFESGERVRIVQWENYDCTEADICDDQNGNPYSCLTTYTIPNSQEVLGTINGTVVTLDNPLSPGNYVCNGGNVQSSVTGVYVYKLANNKKGGNLRVRSITLKDEFNGIANKSSYLYTKDGARWTTSSGVVSMEPDYIKTTDHYFYKWLGYQASPVLYGTVTVLTGKLSTDDDYYSRQVFEFETPTINDYRLDVGTYRNNEFITAGSSNSHVTSADYSTMKHFQISRKSGKVGKLKSVKTYSKAKPNTPYSSQSYFYTESVTTDGANLYQGVFTEGTLLFEIVKRNSRERYNKGLRTTVIDNPYVLKKVINTEDGIQTETENMNWDLYTGAVLESRTKSGLGLSFKSIVEPAYKSAYPEMGSKAVNPAYKNMLSQTSATYSYKLDHLGNEVGLVSATANVWKKGWQYRKLNTSTNEYEVENLSDVYRKTATYVYKGDYTSLNNDGTQRFAQSNKFNFTTLSANTKWQSTGSTEKYTHGSATLETKDMNGIYSAKKVGYNDLYTIATASNARFDEIAFCSAEDRLTPTSAFFGGEVKVGTGATTIVATPVHTGKQALQVPAGATGFIFKRPSISEPQAKSYRASVWANSNQGRIFYKINGAETTLLPTFSQPVILANGTTWYRLEITIPNVPASAVLEAGVKTASGSVVFDDFRLHPIQSTLTGYVYYPDTKQLMATLDNDNLSTRYEYNDRGLLTKTYRESLTYGEKLVSESADNYRRFTVDQ
jgi:hypothetical protein